MIDELCTETSSARCHNMDAEEIIGMFSAGKQGSKDANVDFLRLRMRAKKNGIIAYVDDMFKDERELGYT